MMVRIGRPQERLLSLSDAERDELERISRSLSARFSVVRRAQIVLASAGHLQKPLQISDLVILMSVFNVLGIDLRLAFGAEKNGLPIEGRGGIETTVDQTLIRGLDTAGPWYVSGLPLSQMARVTVSGSQNHSEGYPDRPPRPTIGSAMTS